MRTPRAQTLRPQPMHMDAVNHARRPDPLHLAKRSSNLSLSENRSEAVNERKRPALGIPTGLATFEQSPATIRGMTEFR